MLKRDDALTGNVQSRRQFSWEKYLEERRRRRWQSAALLAAGIVAGLVISFFLWQGEHYLMTGFTMIGFIIVLFFGHFERRRPRAREVVLLSTLTALSVAMNEICAHTVPLHAGTAMIVICGISLGPEAGFLVGALSRFVCNFFDGQGPWTPWQMIAWGMIGYLSGISFNKVERRKEEQTLARRLSLEKGRHFQGVAGPCAGILSAWVLAYVAYLCRVAPGQESFFGWRLYIYGAAGLLAGCLVQRRKLPVNDISITLFTFFIVFLLYGGIMNFAAMLLVYVQDSASAQISWESLRALYLTGVPYDAAHAGAAALCMFFFGDSILQKLERLQIKYGITF